jgi:hypothetical protein
MEEKCEQEESGVRNLVWWSKTAKLEWYTMQNHTAKVKRQRLSQMSENWSILLPVSYLLCNRY